MVTNLILKNQSYSERYNLANKLDTIADGVIKRGVLVVEKNSFGFFNLIDYFNKRVVVHDIPTSAIANALCSTLNSKKLDRQKSLVNLGSVLEQYHKLNNDCLFFRHTIKINNDPFKVEVALVRLDITLAKLKYVHYQMTSYL